MGGFCGSKIGGPGGGAQYTLFKLVYILEESVAYWLISCRFATGFERPLVRISYLVSRISVVEAGVGRHCFFWVVGNVFWVPGL